MRWAKGMMEWEQPGRRRGRPRTRWIDGMEKEMARDGWMGKLFRDASYCTQQI